MKKGTRSPVAASRKAIAPKKSASPRDSTSESSSAVGSSGYGSILSDMKRLITESRYRAAATVNQELVCLYWQIGRVIVQQQETAQWGDSVVEQLAADLRLAFPDMKGLTKDNVFRMRKFFVACEEIDEWLVTLKSVGSSTDASTQTKVGTLSRQLPGRKSIVGTLSPLIRNEGFRRAIVSLSWSHLTITIGAVSSPAERYFYMQMSVRERWSVRELRRQIESGLYLRYMSVQSDPEKCLPTDAERGDLLPFKDHYVLEFLGLSDEHSEQELRKAILANLRDFFLEFGRDLAFIGEEYPLTVGGNTFYVDLVFFHRRLQCLIAVELKIGSFQPEFVGKSLFYIASLDEQVCLLHESPSIGLILCRDADQAQARLALTPAAQKIGVATYETALPDLRLIQQRLEQFQIPTSAEVLR